jgi:hypothetical protein
MVLSAASNEAAIEIGVRRIGPALVFERLWEEDRLPGGDHGAGGLTAKNVALHFCESDTPQQAKSMTYLT